MAKSRKGRMPPALARYWANKRRGSSGGGGKRRLRSNTRGSARGSSGISIGGAAKLHPLMAMIFAIGGYVSGKALSSSGVPWAIFAASQNGGGRYSNWINSAFNANGGSGNPTNAFSDAGTMFYIKSLGLLLGGWAVAKSVHTGRVDSTTINVLAPLAAGMMLDPLASDRSTHMGGGGSSGYGGFANSISSGRFG